MNLRRLAGRAAAAGALGALGVGTLTGVTLSPASADAAAVEYTCSALGSSFPVLVQPTGSVPQLKAGQSVAAGAINMPVKFTLSRAVLDGMAGKGINSVGISTDSLNLALGSTAIGLTGLSVPMTSVPASGDLVLTGPGKNAAFTAPAAGTYDLNLPAAFSATVATNLIPLTAACAIADPAAAKIGSVDVADPAGPQGLEYTCAINGGSVPVFVEASTVPAFSSVIAGSTVAAGKQIKVNYTIPAAAAALLTGAKKASFGSDDFGFRVGSVGTVPATSLTSSEGAIAAGEHLVLPAEGTTKEFPAPAAGTYDLKLPASFTGTLTTDAAPASSGPCTLKNDSSSTVGSLTVTPAPKQSSMTKATAPKSVVQGKPVKISVTVTTAAPASGSVTAKEGSKTLGSSTLAAGKASITVKGLKPGKHKITVVYSGDSSTNGSSSPTVTVTVKKKK